MSEHDALGPRHFIRAPGGGRGPYLTWCETCLRMTTMNPTLDLEHLVCRECETAVDLLVTEEVSPIFDELEVASGGVVARSFQWWEDHPEYRRHRHDRIMREELHFERIALSIPRPDAFARLTAEDFTP